MLFRSLALRANDTVAAWGRNFAGETTVPAGLTNVVAIAAGFVHSLAVRSDGSIVAWGLNANGQTNAPAMSGVFAIAAGGAHSLAVGQLVGAPPRITTGISGGNLIFMWNLGAGASLEQSSSLTAPTWTPVTSTPPFTVPANGPLQFFRLRVQ